jgi:hypothetical protein
MNNLLNRSALRPLSLSSYKATTQSPSLVRKLLYMFIWVVVVLALVSDVALLTSNLFFTALPHAPAEASPLLFIGTAYLGSQVLLRPKPLDLFKALIVSESVHVLGS